MQHPRATHRHLWTLGAVGSAILCACVHPRAKILNPVFPRAGMCFEAVAVFAAPTEIGKEYIEVAELSVAPHGGDWAPSPQQVQEVERKKAAQLGANGIILRHLSGGREVLYDDALAIFIPQDSARAAELCATKRPSA